MEYKSGWMNGPIIVIDVETTGLIPGKDRIIEISAVRLERGQITDAFATLVKPGIALAEGIVELTGIREELLDDAPPFERIAQELVGFISDGYPIVAGDHAAHGVRFLQAELKRCNLQWMDVPTLEIAALARYVYPTMRSYSLSSLCKRFDVSLRAHGRAADVAQVLAELLRRVDAQHPNGVSLGALRMLTIISDAVEALRKKEVRVSLDEIDMNDPALYIQIAQGGICEYASAIAPCCFDELAIAIAFNRPWLSQLIPRYLEGKNDPLKVDYPHGKMWAVLESTGGCIVYHQQIEKILHDLAGFSEEACNLVRRNMAKKKRAEIDRWRERFILKFAGGDKAAAVSIFDELTVAAAFTVNEEKMREMAALSLRIAWLKGRYSEEVKDAVERCGIKP